jgi:hypothetical protein
MARSSSSDARKLLTPETITRIEAQFHLPEDRTEIQSDWHYQSTEMPKTAPTVCAPAEAKMLALLPEIGKIRRPQVLL